MVVKKKKTGRQKCFIKRDMWLKRLGFETYQNYLLSPTWKRIRTELLDKRKRKCYFCLGYATEAHHTRYTKSVLLGEGSQYLNALVATCRGCHKMISDYAKSEKIHEDRAFQLWNIKRKTNDK